MPTLRSRASVWLEGAGFFEGAIRQAIVAADYQRVGLLIARHWYGYVSRRPDGDGATVARVVTRRDDHPRCGARPGEGVDLCPRWPARGEREISGVSREHPLRRIASRRNCLGGVGRGYPPGHLRLRRRPECTVEAARRAAELEPGESSPWAALVRFALGSGLYLSGEISRARKPLEEALCVDGGWPAPGAGGHLILPVVRCGGRRAPGGSRVACACGASAGGGITAARDSPD